LQFLRAEIDTSGFVGVSRGSLWFGFADRREFTREFVRERISTTPARKGARLLKADEGCAKVRAQLLRDFWCGEKSRHADFPCHRRNLESI